jgi:uncharacterized protein YbjT (DUF2867 family)
MSNTILVLGSTGKTGKRVSEHLQNLQIPIRLGSRQVQPPFDWENFENWEVIFSNIKSVYITFQPDLAVPSAVVSISKLVEVAKVVGVEHLVLLSGRGEKESEICENVVINSGLDWTIIRASWFMQNFSENFLIDGILSNNVVLPTIKALEPFVDTDDIADVVVEVLINRAKHSNKIYELTGSELLSFKVVTSQIATALNRTINYTEISMDDYVAMLKSYQVPDDFIWLIQYLFTEMLDGRNQSLSNDIENILNRKPTTFSEYVTKTAKTGIWKV